MASSMKSEKTYDVFLSFRGEDIQKNLLGHLYTALDQKGIYTYVDSEELKKGEQIAPALMTAIEESRIAIIIFSEDYASSWWCLEEVAKIMDCKEESDLMVFSVFYKVEPKEVRTPRDKYKTAMLEHESKFGKDSKKVKRWKKALFNAGSLSGWHLQDGDEAELIKGIVKEISTHLDHTPLHVAKHLVGIDSRVHELKLMLNLESKDGVVMMGLWGQGGIGKTTLGKALYNAIFGQFDGSCFLADVREVSENSKNLAPLQKTLLSQILSENSIEVSSVHRGINQIQARLRCKKVLLILDDVDDRRQLNALAGERKWFGNGSRVIITTRDSDLLKHQDYVYEVKALDDSGARDLFCRHAFPTQELINKKDLVDGVLNHAKGLPLALEVLGSFLFGREEGEWVSTLEKISAIPNKTINDVLKISYEGLEENEREIFLHVACFFKGWEIEYIKQVLDTCDFKAVIGLKILIERSLISIKDKQLQMHDLIQFMGMDIVNQECRDDLGKRSRLWLYDDVLDVLSTTMGDCAVKAIVLKLHEPIEMCIGPDAFTKMRKLKLLIVHKVSFQGPVILPDELKWLGWAECSPWIPEFSSRTKKLVALDICGGKIQGAPTQFEFLQGFPKLTDISFYDCNSLVCTPDLSGTPNLMKLELRFCDNLIEAHESIANHDKLQILQIYKCYKFRDFPVLNSKNLQALIIENCENFKRFPEIPHKLEGLQYLVLVRTGIQNVPTSIRYLVSLRRMCLNSCSHITSLPSSIYELQNLEVLEFQECKKLIEFPKYRDSTDLRMKTGLSKLRELNLGYCKLYEVEFLENLSCCPLLEELDLYGNNIISLPTSIHNRNHLRWLRVSTCDGLQQIPRLPPFLTWFQAKNCTSLKNNDHLTSLHDFVGRMSTMADISSEEISCFSILLPGRMMPKWIVPIKKHSVSFMASKGLYDKFLGLALCVVLKRYDLHEEAFLTIKRHVNGKSRGSQTHSFLYMDSYHIYLKYLTPYHLWGEVNFGEIDGNYAKFSLSVSRDVIEWGLRIICKPLEDDLKIEIQDNQLINLALLQEVDPELAYSEAQIAELIDTKVEIAEPTYLEGEDSLSAKSISFEAEDGSSKDGSSAESTYLEDEDGSSVESTYLEGEDGSSVESTYLEGEDSLSAESTYLEGEDSLSEDSLSEAHPQADLQDCQMSIEEHSQIVPKRTPELFSLQASEPRQCGLLIRLAEMSMAVFARCFCC